MMVFIFVSLPQVAKGLIAVGQFERFSNLIMFLGLEEEVYADVWEPMVLDPSGSPTSHLGGRERSLFSTTSMLSMRLRPHLPMT